MPAMLSCLQYFASTFSMAPGAGTVVLVTFGLDNTPLCKHRLPETNTRPWSSGATSSNRGNFHSSKLQATMVPRQLDAGDKLKKHMHELDGTLLVMESYDLNGRYGVVNSDKL